MSDPDVDKLRARVLKDISLDIELLQEMVVDASIIAAKRGYACEGWDALYVLFAERFSWTPEKVRSLKIQELSWMIDSFFRD